MSTLRLAAVAAAISVVAVVVGIVPRSNGPGTTNPTSSPSPVATPALLPTACPPGTVLPSGTIATVAGYGITFSTGDGGPATAAGVRSGVHATSPSMRPGALYIPDNDRTSIRRIGTDGVISRLRSGSRLFDAEFPDRPRLRCRWGPVRGRCRR